MMRVCRNWVFLYGLLLHPGETTRDAESWLPGYRPDLGKSVNVRGTAHGVN